MHIYIHYCFGLHNNTLCSQVISMYFFYEFSYYTPNNIFGVKSYINYAVLYAKHHFWCQVIPMNFFYIFTYYTPNTIFGVKSYITYAVLYAKHHFWCQVIYKYLSTYLLTTHQTPILVPSHIYRSSTTRLPPFLVSSHNFLTV